MYARIPYVQSQQGNNYRMLHIVDTGLDAGVLLFFSFCHQIQLNPNLKIGLSVSQCFF